MFFVFEVSLQIFYECDVHVGTWGLCCAWSAVSTLPIEIENGLSCNVCLLLFFCFFFVEFNAISCDIHVRSPLGRHDF